VTTTTLVSILIGVAVAALLVVRQLRAQPLNANFRLPLIIGIIGLIELVEYLGKHHVSGIAIAALVGSLAGSTILLYLVVTYTVQRLIMQARAQRLPVSNDRAGSLISHRL
jgi:hypothetical protein